jgi:hypothetical protein
VQIVPTGRLGERDCRFIYSSCDIDFETVGAITFSLNWLP